MNRVALLIPHFNDADGLYASLVSIDPAEQVDVFVVDDGSTRVRFNEDYARAQYRAQGDIIFIQLPRNLGIDGALNAGLAEIHRRGYIYVARLDCNDRHVGPRLALQTAWLDAHPEVVLLGTAAVFCQGDVERFTVSKPQEHADIRRAMQRDSAFVHPTVMFRAGVVDEIGLYPTDFPAAEDFEYFWRMLERHRVANLADVLVRTEYNDAGISLARRRTQQWSRLRILWKHFDGSPHAVTGLIYPLVSLTLPLSLARRIKRLLGIKAWA